MEMGIKKDKTTAITLVVAFLLVVVGLISNIPTLLGNMILVGVFIVVVPYFYRRYSHYRWVKAVEDQFPNFIRDLADSSRSGMSFVESVKIASKGNYGKLSPEVHRMHNKLSWGIPFIRVIDMFFEKVRESRIITEALTIIKESYQSGGNISSTLDTIASDIIMLKDTESDRISMVKQNVMIMYGIFFMFVGISIMIIFVMVPMIQTQPSVETGSFGFSFSNPCEGAGFFPCNYFNAISTFLGVPGGIGGYYISIFFTVVAVLGFFTGLIAGQLGENSVTAGSKHALILTFTGIGIFIFIAQSGMFPV